MFVAFAPRENPKIAIAVVIENSGYGNTWAAPIAGLLMEKYLNDTLRTERLKQVDYIAGSDLRPGYLDRLQYIEDSTRAFKWFEMTKDSSYIRKYLKRGAPYIPNEDKRSTGQPRKSYHAILPDRNKFKNEQG